MNGMRGIRDIDVFPPENFDIKILIESYLEYHAGLLSQKRPYNFKRIYFKNTL